MPSGQSARAHHDEPHEPDVVVTGPRPGSTLEEYCAQNPYTPICGYGGSGGMMTCPYSGASVSRGEDCPEFSGGGGGGGGGGCANSYSSDCGSDDGDNSGEDDEDIEETAEDIYGCVGSRATERPSRWPSPGATAPSSFQDVELKFENLLPAGKLGEARIKKNRRGEVVGWSIVIDADENKYKASSLGATVEQMLAHTMLHEYIHFLYGPSESNAESKAQEWYEQIYNAPSPTSSDFQRGLHGKGGTSETDPCG